MRFIANELGLRRPPAFWDEWNFWLKLPFFLFFIASICDMTLTTWNFLTLKMFPEINPVYKLVGNFWIFLTINIILTIIVLIIYEKTFNKPSTLMMKFVMYSILLLSGITRLVGAASNIKWIITPVTDPTALQQISNTVATQGTQIYINMAWNWTIYPFIMIYMMFWLFQKAVRLKTEETEEL